MAAAPFRCLGHLSGIYYYYSSGEQAIVALSAALHSKNSLYRLAPHEYWAKKYPGEKAGSLSVDMAVTDLMQQCQKMGIFSMSRVRGRGVWMEKGQPVIHFGNMVKIGDICYEPFKTPGNIIYELADALGFEPAEPLSDKHGAQFTELMKQLRWETKEQYMWFSGWLIVALIGGALPWRPHIWLTGAAQSGKTTLTEIMKKFLRTNCLNIQSASTEAGIRQTLKADCLAVVMDEAEREDATSHNRIQSIITLARQASSDNDSRIVKGSPTGKAQDYLIRSPFCLSSINSSLVQTADKGRFTNVELSSDKLSGEAYATWKKSINELLTEEYITKLYNRIFSMIPTVIHNAKILADAIEIKTANRRLGDQYGALLAGFRAYYSNDKIALPDAEKFIANITFGTEKHQATGRIDQYALLDTIMQHIMRIPKDKGFIEKTIAEMCNTSARSWEYSSDCKCILANIGIKVHDDHIYIANDNKNLKEILKNSNWPNNWHQTLKRIPEARMSDGAIYFNAGCKPRAIILPLSSVIQIDE